MGPSTFSLTRTRTEIGCSSATFRGSKHSELSIHPVKDSLDGSYSKLRLTIEFLCQYVYCDLQKAKDHEGIGGYWIRYPLIE